MQPRRREDAETAAEGKMSFEEFRARRGEGATDPITELIIGAMIEVHRVLGPGLTELMYENALCREFNLRQLRYARQVPISVEYKGVTIGDTRLDLVVEDRVIVELKACESLNPVHRAQVICYLRATKLKIALLVNFNVAILKDGIKRIILS